MIQKSECSLQGSVFRVQGTPLLPEQAFLLRAETQDPGLLARLVEGQHHLRPQPRQMSVLKNLMYETPDARLLAT